MSYQSNHYPEHPLDSWWSDKIYYNFDQNTIGEMIGYQGKNIKRLINTLYYRHGSNIDIHIENDGVIVYGSQYDVIRSIPLIWEAIPKDKVKTNYYRLDWNYTDNDYSIIPHISSTEISSYVIKFLKQMNIEVNLTYEHDDYGVTFIYTHREQDKLNLIYNLIDFKVKELIDITNTE